MLNNKATGIIFANMHDNAAQELTANRSLASVPFLGRYRLIDPYLSSLAEAGVNSVGIVTKSNYHSLMEHIGSGRDWDLSRRKGISILPPYSYSDSNGSLAYHGRMEALYGILNYLEKQGTEYTVMMDTDHVCHPDFVRFVEDLEHSGADCSIMCHTPDTDEESLSNCFCVRPDASGRVTAALDNACAEGYYQSMNIFAVRTSLLIRWVREATAKGLAKLEQDILAPNLDTIHVRCFLFDGFVRRISSLRTYYEANLEMIDPAKTDALLDGRVIRTKVFDYPPVRYGLDSEIRGSIVSDGSVIDGTVENSVLFRGVRVGRNAVVRDCVLMQGTVVEDGAELTAVITDKNVTISAGTRLDGAASYPLYIKKGTTV